MSVNVPIAILKVITLTGKKLFFSSGVATLSMHAFNLTDVYALLVNYLKTSAA